jgi:Mg-chelatase subunit ChlD
MIQSASIQFHDNKIASAFPAPFPEFSEEFGIVKINMQQQTSPVQKQQHFVFSIDESGSMYDLCKDGRTKMSHILFTLENMIRIFAEKYDNTISIHVNVFSNETKNIIHNTIVSSSNIEELIEKIRKIRPKDATNIDNALQRACKDIEEYKQTNLNSDVTHLFLTDGRPTIGNESTSYLKTLVSSEYPNIFIGYGTDHDPCLMSELSHHNNGFYCFIEALEKASLVYGELIHNLLYKLVEDATITIKNGEIYNYKTNTWESTLYIGNLVSEMEKIYQIRSSTPNQVECIINNPHSFQYIINSNSSNKLSDVTNLTNYIFRQKTQELLYAVKQYSIKQNVYNDNTIFPFGKRRFSIPRQPPEQTLEQIPEQKTATKNLKEELYNFFILMTDYVELHNLKDNKFLKMLCDDIYINYCLFGKRYSALVSCARQTSQGAQTTYNVGVVEEYNDLDTVFRANQNRFCNYSTSDSFDSPYSTLGVIDTITEFSYGPTLTVNENI